MEAAQPTPCSECYIEHLRVRPPNTRNKSLQNIIQHVTSDGLQRVATLMDIRISNTQGLKSHKRSTEDLAQQDIFKLSQLVFWDYNQP